MAAFVTFLFFVSGVVALAYEVVWVRAIGLVVGNSLWATVAVVAAYMGGMALGSAAVARLAPRLRCHVRLYGAAEALAALAALATPQAVGVLTPLAARLGPDPLAGWGAPLLGRFFLAWLFLAVPTFAMGTTLPLLAERVGRTNDLGGRVSRLYAANTFGAVLGVVLAGFVGLPTVGERGTLAVAAAAGLIVAGAAWLAEGKVPPAVVQPAASDGRVLRSWLLFPALFGFVALACELVWTRLLLLHLGSRVYTFAIVLAVYLLGIAAGAALARRWRGEPARGLALSQQFLAVSLAAQLPLFIWFGGLLGWLATHLRPVGFIGLQLNLALAVACLLILPTLACGASFPLAVAAFSSRGPYATRTGAVAAANTLGGIAGTVLGPLFLVPLLGSQNTLLLLAVASVLASVLLVADRALRARGLAVAVVLVVLMVALPRGAVLRGVAALAEGQVEALRESASATVVVRRLVDARGVWRSLELNGVNVAGTSPELRAIQRLQGHLPLLLHAAPESVLHIGFGSGGTAWAVARHGVQEIVIAEISPEVLAVSDTVFEDVNHGVLADPRVRVVLNDGRNVLLATAERFDVILSDSIHPVYAGNSTLYTREYFALCRAHLKPGGVVSMWLPMYSLSVESYLAIMRAFREVFPTACIWYDPVVLNEFTVVTGQVAPAPVKLRWELLRDPSLAETLAEAGIRGAADVARALLLGPREVAALVAETQPHIDDFPEVEYHSGRLLDRDGSWRDNFLLLYAMRARHNPFASFPGNWETAARSRDDLLRAELRQLRARIASR